MSKRVANRRGPSRNKGPANRRRKKWLMEQFNLEMKELKRGRATER